MIELEHASEPRELRAFRRRYPNAAWSDPRLGPIRSAIRVALEIEQEGLCAYCESAMKEGEGHLDHIKPRGHRRDLSLVYNNLAFSCGNRDHCGSQKEDRFIPVEPRAGCNHFFALSALDGRLDPAPGLTDGERREAAETLEILGLNHASLAWRRKGYADAVLVITSSTEVDNFIATAPFRWSLRRL